MICGAMQSAEKLFLRCIKSTLYITTRQLKIHEINMPKPGSTKINLIFKVHYPEDGEYTIKPLKMTKLAGRHPETGRIIHGKRGGGLKHDYFWVDWKRVGPTDGTFYEERVLSILVDPNRSARIALVCNGEYPRYILASENMKAGDLIRTSSYIPPIPVRPKEGDAYPVGALPNSTKVHCIEMMPGEGGRLVKAAGTSATVLRQVNGKVLIELPSKAKVALDPECMATVGRLSNINHGNEHIGSASRLRMLGIRPGSGLWQRKDGYCGRKIRPPPPVKEYKKLEKEPTFIQLTLDSEEYPRRVIPMTDRVT